MNKKITSKDICWFCDWSTCRYHHNRKANPRHCKVFKRIVKGRIVRKKNRQKEKILCKQEDNEFPTWTILVTS